MKSKSMGRVRRNHSRYHQGRDDLNIVPMIDMMVILVFFLIFTAVFSKTNILELNLPSNNQATPELPKGLKLEIIVHPSDIVINDRNSGPLKTLTNSAAGYDYDALSLFMRNVKSQFPDMTDATVLLGPDVPYDVLVQVMDTVRVYQLPVLPYSKAELFPDIAVGDADMTPYRIRRHRKRRHGASHFALIPFIDMMTILVVFLLAHTADTDILPNSKNIHIPQSNSERKPRPAVVVMITRDSVFVDGQPVGTIAELTSGPDPIIGALKQALLAQNDTIIGTAQKTDISKREVTIMGDKGTPYSVLKKIMFTCSDADYGKVSLAVVERERAAS